MFRKEVSKTLRLMNHDEDDDLDHCINRIVKEIKKSKAAKSLHLIKNMLKKI